MVKANVHDVKTHLSKYLKKVASGETVIICKRNVPVAEIRPIPAQIKGRRRIGGAKGEFVVPDDFNGPLPKEILDAFYGKDGENLT